jgi:hypothetical protein
MVEPRILVFGCGGIGGYVAGATRRAVHRLLAAHTLPCLDRSGPHTHRPAAPPRRPGRSRDPAHVAFAQAC